MDDLTGGRDGGGVDGSAGDPTAAALAHVIQDYGRRAGENPARLKAMLNDTLAARAGDHRAAVDALVVAAEEGVPAALVGMGPDDTERASALAQRLTGWGLSADMAAWAISAWAAALGGALSVPALPLPPTSLPTTSLPATSLPPTTVPPPPHGGPAPAPSPSTGHGPEVVYGPTPAATPGRNRRAFVAAGVAVALAAVAGTAYALSGTGSGTTASPTVSGGATSSAGPSFGAPGENTPSTLPSISPSTVPSPTTSAVSTTKPGSPAATHTHAPTPHATKTAVKPPPPKPKPTVTTTPVPNPVAANWSATYTVKVCGADWCEASWVLHDGGTWDTVVIVSTSPGYGRARGSGKTLYYWPRQNGTFTDYVKFYVLNSKTGQKSNVATFTVTVTCNTSNGNVCS